MELCKILHDVYEASKHWHLPLFAGLISSIRLHSNREFKEEISDLGDLGDNVPATLILSSRRGL